VRIATTLFAGAFVALSAVIGLRAFQGGQGGGAPRPLVPMTASTLARDPFPHLGTNVSMMATVEALLSKTVFTVDQDKTKATGQEVVVIAPSLQAAPVVNAYVTVQGEVIRFEAEEVAKKAPKYALELTPDLIAKYKGRPAVIATAVIDTGLTDLAKRPIPPPTPTEVAMSGHMKIINSAMGVIRGGLEKPDAAQMKEQVAALKKAFTDTEALFKSGGPAQAAVLAAEAVKAATAMEAAVGTAKWDDVKTTAGSVQSMCATCHGQFRDRMDDGSYRIRMGGGGDK
jgi:cytochrome c556